MKRKKLLLRLGITFGVLIMIYLIVRITGGFQMYNSPTSANSPQIEPNDYLFASNWITPKRFDFVCYEAVDELYGFGVFTHRLCGLPGDTIQIINGDLYVNSRNADRQINVYHNFRVPSYNERAIRKLKNVDVIGRINLSDSIYVSMNSRNLKQWMQAEKIMNDGKTPLHAQFPANWTNNNFGPLIIPAGKVFLLGDNRDNSIDSRTRGLTNEEDITGVIFNKN